MTDQLYQFEPKIEIIQSSGNNEELRFILSGSDEYGLDKSVVNAIRRVLLTEIPTIAFNIYEDGENNDLIMNINNTSLHNEMLLHRISLIPLYINPENYMKQFLFECKVKHDSNEPFKFITMNDISIYPLKSGFLDRIHKLQDKSLSKEDEELLHNQVNNFSIDNYDLKKPLSQKEKDKIFRPFEFKDHSYYSLITELKTTNSDDTFQELHFYGSPSIGIAKEHAKFQSVSQATYSFLKNEELIKNILSEKIKIENLSDKNEIEIYTKKFMLAESERYFYRDSFNEPNKYNFSIKSNHYYDSETLFKKAIHILIHNCENLKLQFIEFLKENDSTISIENTKEYIYQYEILNQTHTLGNLIQNHIMNKSINDKSILNSFSYKITHPLEDKILFIVSINKNHKLFQTDEIQKIQSMTTFIMEQIDEIISNLRILYKVSEKQF